jgi:hypothetical protein
MSTGFVCELCSTEVLEGEPFIRISADPAIQIDGEITSLTDNEIIVFSVYHSSCLMNTYDNPDISTDYIHEARIAIGTFELCDECKARLPVIGSAQTSVVDPKDIKPRHLTLVPETE